MGCDPKTPHHSPPSRRSATVEVPRHATAKNEALHLVIDSTGLKLLGKGEWHVFKRRASDKRRSRRSLHPAVRDGGLFVGSSLTGRHEDDADAGAALLDELDARVASFRADGAYDTKAIYGALADAGTADIDVATPARRTASSTSTGALRWGHRRAAVERSDVVGRRLWREQPGAQQQARGENAVFRFESLIGESPRARAFDRQNTEASMGAAVFDRVT